MEQHPVVLVMVFVVQVENVVTTRVLTDVANYGEQIVLVLLLILFGPRFYVIRFHDFLISKRFHHVVVVFLNAVHHNFIKVDYFFDVDWIVVLKQETVPHTIPLDINNECFRNIEEQCSLNGGPLDKIYSFGDPLVFLFNCALLYTSLPSFEALFFFVVTPRTGIHILKICIIVIDKNVLLQKLWQ